MIWRRLADRVLPSSAVRGIGLVGWVALAGPQLVARDRIAEAMGVPTELLGEGWPGHRRWPNREEADRLWFDSAVRWARRYQEIQETA